jgi:hypothetical protein
LVWHSKKTGNPLPKKKKKDDWTLNGIIDELLHRKLITDMDATKMHCIRKLRNSFIHEEYSLKLSSGMAQKVNAWTEDIINYTTLLREKYDKSV